MATGQRGTLSLEGIPSARGKRFALVVSEWNAHITDALAQGARDTLVHLGVKSEDIENFAVPGSFELIHGCKVVASSLEYDAVIAIGSVIRGETAHFDFVCQGVTHGIAELNAHGKTPVIFCVLTDDTEQQSLDRCGGKLGNKGDEAAVAAVKMAQF
ncbi:MAG TPA: 6,7-dimethyl-8-ribityllumazine synthase [Cryomorphaceae bacterium]|jgi:6,7-dimethyl-8-ribityllumazine synthase|nr:6,7-dimethyl-8-ribityllumazine synthase [Cryomorphaceae bacterium]HBJ71812.1 6,7-dimethyl-8-ribityllumazine synthase [Cryomorphaceae bacterium]